MPEPVTLETLGARIERALAVAQAFVATHPAEFARAGQPDGHAWLGVVVHGELQEVHRLYQQLQAAGRPA